MKRLDLTNKRFGKIVCIKPLRVNNHKEVVWLCKCDCGNFCEKSSGTFKNISKIASCGCMKGKKPHITNLELKNYKPIHECYVNMKTRCYNPNYELYSRYGGRGIKVCDEWLGENGYNNFKKWALENGYKKELSIDKINNDGNYSPDNCRWVNQRIQNINKRPSVKNSSGFVGVRKHSNCNKYYGSVKINDKGYYTGMSDDIIIAAIMRNNYIIDNNLDNELNDLSQYADKYDMEVRYEPKRKNNL